MKAKYKTAFIILSVICVAGAMLMGFNAGKLSQRLNVALFVTGLAVLSLSVIEMGMIGYRARRDKDTD